MKRMFVLFLMCSMLSVWSVAASEKQGPTRRALAEELLNLMNVKENAEQSFVMVKQMMSSQIEKLKQQENVSVKVSSATEKTMDMTMDIMAKELSWDKMKDEYINLYAETFTEEELKGIIDFYKSPAGQAFSKKQPELMRRTMEMSQEKMAQIMPKIREMTREHMQQRAKDKEKKKATSEPESEPSQEDEK